MLEQREVVVIGAGPAGAAAALTLAGQGRDVVLVDEGLPRMPAVGEMLSGEARAILDRLGVARGVIESVAVPSYGAASLWSGKTLLERPSILDPFGESWHLDRGRFDAQLAAAAVAGGADRVRGRAIDCRGTAAGWTVDVQRPGERARSLHAPAVVAATGRSARLTGSCGGRRSVRDRLMGIAVHFPVLDGDGYALLEAVPYGWWYSGLAPPDQLVVTLMTDSDVCRELRATELTRWLRLLGETSETRARIAGRTPLGTARAFGAASHRLARDGFDRPWIAVGDAALAVDPLSASGIQRALQTGTIGAEAMGRWLDGNDTAVLNYETWLDAELSRYWVERRKQYSMQTRWWDEPFWRRRTRPG